MLFCLSEDKDTFLGEGTEMRQVMQAKPMTRCCQTSTATVPSMVRPMRPMTARKTTCSSSSVSLRVSPTPACEQSDPHRLQNCHQEVQEVQPMCPKTSRTSAPWQGQRQGSHLPEGKSLGITSNPLPRTKNSLRTARGYCGWCPSCPGRTPWAPLHPTAKQYS